MIISTETEVLLPKFCKKCGEKLVYQVGEELVEYDRQTGEKMGTISFTLSCPNRRPNSGIDQHDYFEYTKGVK